MHERSLNDFCSKLLLAILVNKYISDVTAAWEEFLAQTQAASFVQPVKLNTEARITFPSTVLPN